MTIEELEERLGNLETENRALRSLALENLAKLNAKVFTSAEVASDAALTHMLSIYQHHSSKPAEKPKGDPRSGLEGIYKRK